MVRQFYTQDLVSVILKYQVNSKKESVIVASVQLLYDFLVAPLRLG